MTSAARCETPEAVFTIPAPLLERLRDDGLPMVILPWPQPESCVVHGFDHQVRVQAIDTDVRLAEVPDRALWCMDCRTAREAAVLLTDLWGNELTVDSRVTVLRWVVPDFEADLEEEGVLG